MNNKLNYKSLNLLIIITNICLLYFIKDLWLGLVTNLFKIISPFLLAFSLAYVIYPLLKRLINLGSPKWLAILAICVIGIGLIFIIIILSIPLLYKQTLLFLSNISIILSDLNSKYSINLGQLESSLKSLTTNLINNLGSTISNGAISFLGSSISAISTASVVFCASIYFLIDMDKIRINIKKYLKDKNKKTYTYLKKLDKELTKYITGIGLDVLIQGIEYTTVFALIGHPNYLILGILSGISAIIPWIGGLVVAIISLLVSFVIDSRLFLYTIIISLICPIIDGNVIGPKVYGKTNSLHPLLVIFAVSAGGIIAGFWGIALSLPIAITIKTTYNYYQKDLNNKIRKIKKVKSN